MDDASPPRPHAPGRNWRSALHALRWPAAVLLLLCLAELAIVVGSLVQLGVSGGEPGWSRWTGDLVEFCWYASPLVLLIAFLCTVVVAMALATPPATARHAGDAPQGPRP